jgi:hypothetical protein
MVEVQSICKFISFVFRLTLGVLFMGCGTLIGNVGPVDEKSSTYSVSDLTKADPDWEKLPEKKDSRPTSERPDVSYQSKTTSSMISVISSCRPTNRMPEKSGKEDLHSLSNPLFMGASETSQRQEEDLVVQGVPALQTTFSGRINKDEVVIRAVVLRYQTCVYHLLYSSRPPTFSQNEKVFSSFVSSFRVH